LPAPATEIRRLTPDDAALYRDIRLESLALAPEAYGSSHVDESRHPPDWFAERLREAWVAGAFQGDALVGIAAHVVRDGAKHRHKGFLWGVYVRPAARRGGVARRLCQAVLADAQGQVEQVQLSVAATNHSARRLYASLGFVAWGVERNARRVDGRYHDDVHMAKVIVSR